MFCPKCGSMLLPKKVDGKMQMNCAVHGAVSAESKLTQKSDVKLKNVKAAGEKIDVYPIEEATCPKCGNEKAYGWTVQTRSIDEAPTRFYKCTKCSHMWKEYS